MPIGRRSISLQLKIFLGLIVVTLLSIGGTTLVSYLVIKKAAQVQNETSLQNKSLALMSSLDYAVYHLDPDEPDFAKAIRNKLLEISDINGADIILYSPKGTFMIASRDENLVHQKQIPVDVLEKITKGGTKGYDFKFYDKDKGATVTSSYRILFDSRMAPIAIAYFPSYYNNNQFVDIFSGYVQFIVFINLFVILLSIWISWWISKNITRTISEVSSRISAEGQDLKPINYSVSDELSVLVRAYNRMIYQLREQAQLKAQVEREKAWREMAKQVAHEVKNPLTPMKLSMQNFERKFDREDPMLEEKVKKLSRTIVDQVDLITQVATAFSEFAMLPEKEDSIINLNTEVQNIVQVFNKNDIFLHTNHDQIEIKFDRIYLTRIMTNLITNAQQAAADDRRPIINIDVEQFNKKVSIVVEDNGTGIPKEKINQIFEPNFTTKSSGMGLGLTMVKKMIEEYRGTITVKSDEGKGTRFTIILPIGLGE